MCLYELFQLGPRKTVPLSVIEEKWSDLSLPKEQFDELVRIGSFSGSNVEWLKFFALGCSSLGGVCSSESYGMIDLTNHHVQVLKLCLKICWFCF